MSLQCLFISLLYTGTCSTHVHRIYSAAAAFRTHLRQRRRRRREFTIYERLRRRVLTVRRSSLRCRLSNTNRIIIYYYYFRL